VYIENDFWGVSDAYFGTSFYFGNRVADIANRFRKRYKEIRDGKEGNI
jgi:hypothetical protein